MQQEELARLQVRADELRRLVSLPGYQYLKEVASVFLSEYACRPGKTSEERIAFETYSNMKWIMDKTFSTAEQITKAPVELPIHSMRQVKG
jgi:hypothetical protein